MKKPRPMFYRLLIAAFTFLIAGYAWNAITTSQHQMTSVKKNNANTQPAAVAKKETKEEKTLEASASTTETKSTLQLTVTTALREPHKTARDIPSKPSNPVATLQRSVAAYHPTYAPQKTVKPIPLEPLSPAATPQPPVPAYHPAYVPLQQKPSTNPYLAQLAEPIDPAPSPAPTQISPTSQWQGPAQSWSNFIPNIPILPGSDQSILPKIKTVYPTGDKPLVVVSFKCPTEMVGVRPPSVNILHNMVAFGMDSINKTNLLSFNMQQVCQ
jgi:hypothetical protein